MDRVTVYPGQIPLETDLLRTNRNAMTAIGALASALFGSSATINGMACTPTSPASMSVKVAPGEIYVQQNVDSSSYSSLAADTTHQTMKQGILADPVTLSCPAPTTTGFSINYLIQAAFSEVDADNVVLPYYNASDPTTAYTGPANSGTSQPTTRKDTAIVSVKAGTAAATGTQATPAPDSGYVGVWVVSVAYGASTITSGNISAYSSAPTVPSGGMLATLLALASAAGFSSGSGWIKLPTGHIINWGSGAHTDNTGIKTVTFAKPFTTGLLVALATNGASGVPVAFHGVGNQTLTTMTVSSSTGPGAVAAASGTAFQWLAIGI
jgi:hypothetical protein